MENNLLNSLRQYKTFDAYLASGRFAELSQSDMVLVYNHFVKRGKLEKDVAAERKPLVLDARRTLDGEPIEDLSILQPDGSRACANWELNSECFQLIK